jgi:ankyrin repeat protein
MTKPLPAPTRTLPPRPSFPQLRKQAKQLLKSFKAGNRDTTEEVQRFDQSLIQAAFSLVDAQRILARAYGFPSWARLKQHVDSTNVEAFYDAVQAGDLETVQKLAKARPELVGIDRGGRFGEQIAIHLAVLNRDLAMTQLLMQLGSDARKGIWPHREATSALTIATDRGWDDIVTIIEQQERQRRTKLSDAGSTIGPQTDEVFKAIQENRNDDAVHLLAGDLSLISACDVGGRTPLHIAASMHNPGLVGWLIERGADVNAVAQQDVLPHLHATHDSPGKTPLDYAAVLAGWSAHGRDFCFMERSRSSRELFDETSRLLRSAGARLTPRAAVAVGDVSLVARMHREGQLANDIHFFRGGLLSIAVRINNTEMVSQLLALGFDPDEAVVSSDDGSRSWGAPLWFATMCGRHEIAKTLLDHGADVNAAIFACGDAMSIARSTADERLQSLLTDHGVPTTVEHVAGCGDVALAKEILDGKTPARSLDLESPTPIEIAEQMLLAAGDSCPEIVRLCLPCIERGNDDSWWNYAMVRATEPQSLEYILQHGVSPNVVGENGFTLLHHIATTSVEDSELKMATLLLDHGASLKQRDRLLNSTPLGWACRWGHLALVDLYLSRGAVPSEPDTEAWAQPLAWATREGHAEIVARLVEFSAS